MKSFFILFYMTIYFCASQIFLNHNNSLRFAFPFLFYLFRKQYYLYFSNKKIFSLVYARDVHRGWKPAAALERKGYRAAMAYKNKLLRRYFQKPTAAAIAFKKFFEFHCCDCIESEILVLVHQIHLVSGCFICKYWNSTKFMQFFNVLKKMLPWWLFQKPAATAPPWISLVYAIFLETKNIESALKTFNQIWNWKIFLEMIL
jgi:hypothetical protein